MKERPILFSAPMVRAILAGTKTQTRRVVKPQPGCDPRDDEHIDMGRCSYGQSGDRLWVKEAGWQRPERTRKMMRAGADTWAQYYFDADGLTEQDHAEFKEWGFKRRPSIHMPRWASRITLEITGVRVERLQDISADDARAEGCPDKPVPGAEQASIDFLAKTWYHDLWEQINGHGSWDANPWVWVVEFRRAK